MILGRTYERLTAADAGGPEAPASERAKKRQHLPRDRKASDTPRSIGLVSRAYENTLFLEAMPSRYRGMASVFGVLLFWAALNIGHHASSMSVDVLGEVTKGSYGFASWGLALVIFTTLLCALCLITAIRIFRFDLLAPKVIPLVFNRRTRKVYRFSQDVPGLNLLFGPTGRFSLLGLGRYIVMTFLPWPNMLLVEYDWDCLEAEYYEKTGPSGNVIRTDHYLDLYVREAPGSDKVIGSFSLAPSILIGEESAKDLWEHVRRFMEENGPALSPGDQPAPPPPSGFWQAANALFSGPGWLLLLGFVIWKWDKLYWEIVFFTTDHRVNEALWTEAMQKMKMGLLESLGLYFSCFFLAGIFFAVLAAYLSPAVELPPELTADAGAPVDLDELAQSLATVATSPSGGP